MRQKDCQEVEKLTKEQLEQYTSIKEEIKELEAKRSELDKEIEVYLKELGLVE